MTHLKTIPGYNQQDATFLDLFIPKDALHVATNVTLSLQLTILEAVCTVVCS
jgi:hypothetical protein